MYLSMYILAEYLKEFSPKLRIVSGNRDLQNVRILSDASIYSVHNVYLARAEEFIGGEKNKVICVNGHDMIILNTENMDEIFNKLLDCFDFYNDWENSCSELTENGGTLQDILNMSRKFFRDDFYIADQSQFVNERVLFPGPVDPTEEQKKNIEFMKEMYRTNTMPMKNISFVRDRDGSYRSKQVCTALFGENYLPVTIRHLYNGRIFWKRLIINNINTESSIEKEQKLDMLGRIIEHWLSYQTTQNDLKDEYSDLLQRIIESESEASFRELSEKLRNIGWKDNSRVIMYLIRSLKDDAGIFPSILYNLNTRHGCVAGIYADRIVVFRNTEMTKDDFETSFLSPLLSQSRCCAGAGYPVISLKQIPGQYRFVSAALKQGMKNRSKTKKPEDHIIHCSSYILDYFVQNLKEDNAFYPHPAINELDIYDAGKNTELTYTLYQYLLCDRNYVKAAARLHTHRNTVQYRVEKAIELTDIDLENDTNRIYILLSLMAKYQKREL